jgi:hypothetical protein
MSGNSTLVPSKVICTLPATRSVHDVDAGARLEHFADQMRQHADAARGKIHLARIGLGIGDQLLHGVRRHCRIDHEDVGAFADQRDRIKTLERIVAGIGMQQRRDDEPAGAGVKQRIAVGRGFGGVLRADRIAGTGAVFDHHPFAERILQIIRSDPRNDIDRPARRRRHDDFHRAVWIIVGKRRAGCQRRSQQRRRERTDHGVPPAILETGTTALSHAWRFDHVPDAAALALRLNCRATPSAPSASLR